MPEQPQLLLPFAEREYIDVKRAARILGVSERAVLKMCAEGRIVAIDWAPATRKRVNYAGIVALCDELRRRYGIPDRRPPLDNPMLRHRDEDLLPFPLTDTIYLKEACEILGYASARPVMNMIEEGRFEAYFFAYSWRISRSSLAAYVARVRAREAEAFSHIAQSSHVAAC